MKHIAKAMIETIVAVPRFGCLRISATGTSVSASGIRSMTRWRLLSGGLAWK
ncbi:MAG: hypothetical protein WDN72_00780 [Alphaproteobacteria bacterium]